MVLKITISSGHDTTIIIAIIINIIITKPGPAFGRPGLEGIVGTCTFGDGYTPEASLRACGAQLGWVGPLLFGAME